MSRKSLKQKIEERFRQIQEARKISRMEKEQGFNDELRDLSKPEAETQERS